MLGETEELNKAKKNAVTIPYTIKYFINVYLNNSLFFVAINIYVISININVLNYILMIFMFKLLLGNMN